MTSSLKLLLVEDDPRLARLIGAYLGKNGFEVKIEGNGNTARNRILQELPDIVILDLMLPGMDGITICREVRSRYSGPIVMLTAMEDDTDQVVGLEIGADDYVKKPVEPRVLLARLRAVLRRFDIASGNGHSSTWQGKEEKLIFGQLEICISSQRVVLNDQQVELSTNEFELLWSLASNCGQVLDRETLFRKTKGTSYDGLDRSIDISISRLRKKLGDSATKPVKIKTVWGRGYLFVGDAWDETTERRQQ
ncbi:MAG: response regulator [Deltaproteobacteria bacterium]|nr:response regulator [Deltaproteobacteria bacterium]